MLLKDYLHVFKKKLPHYKKLLVGYVNLCHSKTIFSYLKKEIKMITSKQRAYLRSLANSADTILMVGKGGLSEQITKQAADALKARELIKGKVLESCELSVREAAEQIAEETKSEVVQVIGTKFVLYKRNDKDPQIVLPKSKKK